MFKVMHMEKSNFQERIDEIVNNVGSKSPVSIKNFYMGKNKMSNAAIIYLNPLVNKDILDRDILNPLMFKVDADLVMSDDAADFICKKYIAMCNTSIEKDVKKVITGINSGKTALLVDGIDSFILADTSGGQHRSITDPLNETSVAGPREAFVENLETNIGILRRNIKDKNLVIEYFTIGRRSQTPLALLYIQDIAKEDMVSEVKRRINLIDVDFVTDTGMIGQYMEDYPYFAFPQFYTTERPDVVQSNLMEGRAALLLNSTPFALTVPAIMVEFFQGVEDYYSRTLISSFARILRLLAAFIVVSLPSLYLALISYNVELIPTNFIGPIVQFRRGIALSPLLEILAMQLMVEFLREGGLRLPGKIGQTLSIVGGIIIGNTAVESKIVSPTTLLVIGITVISSFLIPNYQMSLSLRFLNFPMLFLANMAGFLGIAAGWYIILVYLFSIDSLGVPYVSFNKHDMEDTFVRYPLFAMRKRPKDIPDTNTVRHGNFMNKIWRKK